MSPISLQCILLKVVYTTGKLGTDPSRKECGSYKFARLNCSYHVFEMGKDLWFFRVWCKRSAPSFCCDVNASKQFDNQAQFRRPLRCFTQTPKVVYALLQSIDKCIDV